MFSQRFMQDVLEDYFGHQREKGRRSDNPTAQQFGYNDLTIAAQRDIAPGNVGGTCQKVKWHKVSIIALYFTNVCKKYCMYSFAHIGRNPSPIIFHLRSHRSGTNSKLHKSIVFCMLKMNSLVVTRKKPAVFSQFVVQFQKFTLLRKIYSAILLFQLHVI